jgi:hypothetical protein
MMAMFIAILAVRPGAALADVQLSWKFTAGESVRFSTTSEIAQDMDIGGQPISTKMTQVMDMVWTVKEASAEEATLDVTIDHVHVEMTPPTPAAKPIVYDSKSDKNEGQAALMASLFGAMVNQPITLTVTPLGEVKNIKLPEGMIAAMQKAGPAAKDVLSEDAMKQTISRVMIAFPEAVTAGKSWESIFETKNPILGTQKAVTTYTYVGPEKAEQRPVEKLDVQVHLSFDQPADAQAKASIKEQASEGSILFDNKQGMPIETTMNSQMKLQISAGGQMIDQTVTTKVLMKQIPAAAK